jgi:hypothetical protein
MLEMSTPAPTDAPLDMVKLMAVAAKHNLEILGPLPE